MSDYYEISTHALREEGDRRRRIRGEKAFKISTHALREEGDSPASAEKGAIMISTHALREEGDTTTIPAAPASTYFYPRPPRGGRRQLPACMIACGKNFYPRPPRGGRLREDADAGDFDGISTHALREEGDSTWATLTVFNRSIFLPTPSARRATLARSGRRRPLHPISTHALREEGDGWGWTP